MIGEVSYQAWEILVASCSGILIGFLWKAGNRSIGKSRLKQYLADMIAGVISIVVVCAAWFLATGGFVRPLIFLWLSCGICVGISVAPKRRKLGGKKKYIKSRPSVYGPVLPGKAIMLSFLLHRKMRFLLMRFRNRS